MDIASAADIESLDSFESNLEYYRENAYTYIPIPSSGKYYHVIDRELKDLDTDQYFHEDMTMMTAFEQLQEHPFLLHDVYMSFESTGSDSTRRFAPTGEREYNINGEYLTASDILEEGDALLNNLPEESVFRGIVESILDPSFDRYYIITLADANKRGARELFYSAISEFETQLANLIKCHYPNSLIPEANDDEIERWYRAKIDKLEIHITEHMNLSTLLTVGGKNEEIRECFGFSSRNQFDKNFGGLNDLRNKVMHPTRALVHDSEDLEKQIDRIHRIQEALEYLDQEQIQPEYPRESDI